MSTGTPAKTGTDNTTTKDKPNAGGVCWESFLKGGATGIVVGAVATIVVNKWILPWWVGPSEQASSTVPESTSHNAQERTPPPSTARSSSAGATAAAAETETEWTPPSSVARNGSTGATAVAAETERPPAYRMPTAAQRQSDPRWRSDPTEEVDTDDPQRPILCTVCLTNPPEMMFTVCGHCGCCEPCVWELATRRGINDGDVVTLGCPQCKRESTTRRVFLP